MDSNNSLANSTSSEESLPRDPSTDAPFPSAIDLIKETIKKYRANFKTIILLVIVPLVSLIAYNGLSLFMNVEGEKWLQTNVGVYAVVLILSFLLVAVQIISNLLANFSIWKLVEEEYKQPVSAIDLMQQSKYLIIPSVYIWFLQTLIIIAGSLVFIIPGIIATFYLMFSTLSLVILQKRGLDALGSSIYYIKGQVKNTLINFIMAMLIGWTAFFIAMALISGLAFLGGIEINPKDLMNEDQPLMNFNRFVFQTISDGVTYLVGMPLGLIYLYLLFKELIKRKSAPNEGEILEERSYLKKAVMWSPAIIIICLLCIILLVINANN